MTIFQSEKRFKKDNKNPNGMRLAKIEDQIWKIKAFFFQLRYPQRTSLNKEM